MRLTQGATQRCYDWLTANCRRGHMPRRLVVSFPRLLQASIEMVSIYFARHTRLPIFSRDSAFRRKHFEELRALPD